MDFIWRQRNDIVHNHSSLSSETVKNRLNQIYQEYKHAWEGKKKNQYDVYKPQPQKMASQHKQILAIIEGDAQSLITTIESTDSTPHWQISPIIENIQQIFSYH